MAARHKKTYSWILLKCSMMPIDNRYTAQQSLIQLFQFSHSHLRLTNRMNKIYRETFKENQFHSSVYNKCFVNAQKESTKAELAPIIHLK